MKLFRHCMYWKRKKTQKEDLQIIAPLILNSQSQMSGDFIIHTDVKIDGSVEGNVTTTKSVIIGEDGHLKGNLKCKNLIVYGSFEGTSEVEESACLQATSEYRGKLNTPSVTIFPGSRVNAGINLPNNSMGYSFRPSDPDGLQQNRPPEETDGTYGAGSENSSQPSSDSFLFKNL